MVDRVPLVVEMPAVPAELGVKVVAVLLAEPEVQPKPETQIRVLWELLEQEEMVVQVRAEEQEAMNVLQIMLD
jgi:hypothetical protein